MYIKDEVRVMMYCFSSFKSKQRKRVSSELALLMHPHAYGASFTPLSRVQPPVSPPTIVSSALEAKSYDPCFDPNSDNLRESKSPFPASLHALSIPRAHSYVSHLSRLQLAYLKTLTSPLNHSLFFLANLLDPSTSFPSL